MEIDFAVLTLKLSENDKKQFKIYYDSPLLSKEIYATFNEWIRQTDEHTEENLVAYIRNKFPSIHCFTEEGFKKILEQFNLEAKPIYPSDN